MVIWDFFDFDEAEYKYRISCYDTHRLRKQEVVKTRQHSAALCSMATGFAGAVPTGGGSLVLTAYGSRRLYVARKKLYLIRAELCSRDVALHELQKRDVLIPVTASLVGAGVGFGLDEMATAATNIIPMEQGLPSGSSFTQALATDSGDTLSGAAHGAMAQVREMGNAVLNSTNGIPAAQDLAQQTVWVPAHSVPEAVGFHGGMVVAQAAEKGAASLAAGL
ncbi:hypothetical protein B0J15DRAFT_432847, partial [Fusarium solani]